MKIPIYVKRLREHIGKVFEKSKATSKTKKVIFNMFGYFFQSVLFDHKSL